MRVIICFLTHCISRYFPSLVPKNHRSTAKEVVKQFPFKTHKLYHNLYSNYLSQTKFPGKVKPHIDINDTVYHEVNPL